MQQYEPIGFTNRVLKPSELIISTKAGIGHLIREISDKSAQHEEYFEVVKLACAGPKLILRSDELYDFIVVQDTLYYGITDA